MKPKEMIAVIEAFDRGEAIQVRAKQFERNPVPMQWLDLNVGQPDWNFGLAEYRIKPKALTKEQQEILNAYEEGKEIQCKLKSDKDWSKVSYSKPIQFCWAWNAFDYRVRPPLYTKEQQEIIDAYLAGKEVQFREPNARWITRSRSAYQAKPESFSFDALEYRIKPEPIVPREFWANVYQEYVGMGLPSEKEAIISRGTRGYLRTSLFREVLE